MHPLISGHSILHSSVQPGACWEDGPGSHVVSCDLRSLFFIVNSFVCLFFGTVAAFDSAAFNSGLP